MLPNFIAIVIEDDHGRFTPATDKGHVSFAAARWPKMISRELHAANAVIDCGAA